MKYALQINKNKGDVPESKIPIAFSGNSTWAKLIVISTKNIGMGPDLKTISN